MYWSGTGMGKGCWSPAKVEEHLRWSQNLKGQDSASPHCFCWLPGTQVLQTSKWNKLGGECYCFPWLIPLVNPISFPTVFGQGVVLWLFRCFIRPGVYPSSPSLSQPADIASRKQTPKLAQVLEVSRFKHPDPPFFSPLYPWKCLGKDQSVGCLQ